MLSLDLGVSPTTRQGKSPHFLAANFKKILLFGAPASAVICDSPIGFCAETVIETDHPARFGSFGAECHGA
jgi:hypothetical protein